MVAKNYLRVPERNPLSRLNYLIDAGTKKEQCPYCVFKICNYKRIYMCGLRSGIEEENSCNLKKEIIYSHRGKGGTQYLEIIAPCLKTNWAKCPFNPLSEKTVPKTKPEKVKKID